ncbi:hypothetical protein O181_012020 [Austropuccinia psidii MF-1]|uniref:Uncharacterized protein n=1 Tax=Austropuccinia psidii MF-1 TaxID=1389203 RepID=A0A9Q3BX29_9BASI|nr:hypothetical protein [Austropuccinia psidii MF-1]
MPRIRFTFVMYGKPFYMQGPSCASKSSFYPDPLKSYHQSPFYPAPPKPQAQSTANATPTTTTNNTSNQIKSSHDSSNSNPACLNPISHSH